MKLPEDAPQILVVDDEVNVRRALQVALENEGFRVHAYDSTIAAFRQLAENDYALAILDIRIDELTGIELYRKMLAHRFEMPVIFMSGNASLSEAIETVRLGAFDFIEKPFSTERLTLTVTRALEHAALKRKITILEETLSSTQLVGVSRGAARIQDEIRKVAPSDATVLIHGESGTGKELIAKLIHENSARRDRPFVRVNCSAIPENLIESELFGFEKGAFTGATFSKRGFFEQANHGTIFLDEIGDMSLTAQAKVLRALQNGEIQKLGSERVTHIHVRTLAATNKDLAAEVAAGRFREDLYYRLNVVPITALPLRERREDVPVLIAWFLKRYFEKNGIKPKVMDADLEAQLLNYAWPGNVRELQNLVERLIIMSGDRIRLSDLPENYLAAIRPSRSYKGLPLKEFKRQSERDYLIQILRETDGNVSQAAEVLGVERTHLHKRLQAHAIEKREYFLPQ